jgi:hypothetical protein
VKERIRFTFLFRPYRKRKKVRGLVRDRLADRLSARLLNVAGSRMRLGERQRAKVDERRHEGTELGFGAARLRREPAGKVR